MEPDAINELLAIVERWANDTEADSDEAMAEIQEILAQHGYA